MGEKENTNLLPEGGSPNVTAQPPQQEERPNRKAFSERFKKRHNDIDFEDKEARYGAMNDDADALSAYEENGKALSEMFDNNRWLAAMAMDLKDNPDLNPIEWMAKQGIDIKAALDDEETGKKVAEQIAKFQQDSADQAKHEEELKSNLQVSADAMEELGLDDDAKLDLWEKFFKVVGDAEDGKVSAETWKLFKNAYSYDDDVATARSEGAMQGRNEKIQNKLRTSEKPEVPPSLSTSGGGSPMQKKPKRSSFFEGLEDHMTQ